jgi:hypothetical protein
VVGTVVDAFKGGAWNFNTTFLAETLVFFAVGAESRMVLKL